MRKRRFISVIIPAFNEEKAVGRVIAALPDWVDEIVVADNGSTDRTAWMARTQGARVISEPVRGYGRACLAGMAALKYRDIIAFLDGDFSDYPEQMDRLVDPIQAGRAHLVIGSRVLGKRQRGALTPQARFGNWLACRLMRSLWGVSYTDLGPFRAISWPALETLKMRDKNFGWTVEMQIKAALLGVPSMEVAVDYRKRIGQSKVSGTLKGVILAGVKILFTLFKFALAPRVEKKKPGL